MNVLTQNADLKRKITDQVSNTIDQVLKAPELYDLSENQIQKIAMDFIQEEYKIDFRKAIKRTLFNEEETKKLIEKWLNLFSSKHTIRSFRRNIGIFVKWLGGVCIIDVNAEIADQYLIYLKKKENLSDNSLRQRIAVCSSFWKHLVRWNIVDHNPFLNVTGIPKKRLLIKQSYQIPSDAQLDLLEKHIEEMCYAKGRGSSKKVRGALMGLTAIRIIRTTGIRIGALNSMVIDANGYYKAKSKGGYAEGRLTKDILNFLKKSGLDPKRPFKEYADGSTFSVWLWRQLTSDKIKEKIGIIFGGHSMRHRFAINYYKKEKDIYALSRLLGHSNPVITTSYLSGLRTEIDENNQ